MNAHEIDYEIFGEEMQFVEIELDPQETVVAEAGSFMMMDDGIQMETIFGDGSQKQGGLFGKVVNAGKRWITGEGLFMTTFTNTNYGKKNVSFASPYPGKIVPLDLRTLNGRFICQKDAFLCKVPPACIKAIPSPSNFCIIKPSPPKSPVPIFLLNSIPTETPFAAHKNASF